MGNLRMATIAALQLMAISVFGQSINVASNTSGNVVYNVTKANKGDLVFTLFGDGDFQIGDYPSHEFDDNTGTYITESFFVESYDLNPPKNGIINTGATSGGSKLNNPSTPMPTEVKILTSWCPAYGTEDFFILAFTNKTSASPVDGCIQFHYKTNDLSVKYADIRNYAAATGPTISYLSTGPYDEELKWTFTNLKQNEVRYLYIPALVKLAIRKPLKLRANYYVNCKPGDGGSGNSATTNYSQQVTKHPHDPNKKYVYPECLEMYNDFQHLEYKITFFNDGEGPANNVVIKDDLPTSLDPSSVSVTGSEHPVTLTTSGQELTFTLTGINLPGLNQDDGVVYSKDDISSFISFSVCTKPPLNNCIFNKATIYFDSQPGISTGTSEICQEEECASAYTCGSPIPQMIALDQDLEIQEGRSTSDFTVYPNPFTNAITISGEWASSEEQQIEFSILDTTGRLLKKWKDSEPVNGILQKEIYLDDLPQGVYFLMIDKSGNKVVKKIMKY